MREPKITKRQEQAQESRQRLLSAARELFVRNGYAETSVHTLCASLGVASSLLYHYFPGGKRELMQVLVTKEMRELIVELNAQNEALDALPVEEMLEQLYQSINATVLRHADVFRLFLQEKEVRELVAYDRLRALLGGRQKWFAALLQKKAERREIREMDFVSAAETLDSLMLYHLAMELSGFSPSRLSGEEQRRRLIAYQVSLWKDPQAGKKIL